MATSLDKFAIEAQLSTTAVRAFGPSSGEEYYIGRFTAANTSTTANVVMTAWMLNNGTTPIDGVGGNWAQKITIPKNRTVTIDKLEGHTLINQQEVYVKADTAGVVNIDASGAVET